MDPAVVTCPQCNTEWELDDREARQKDFTCTECNHSFPIHTALQSLDTAPAAPGQTPNRNVPAIEGVWKEEQGFFHPDWKLISGYIKTMFPQAQQPAAWEAIAMEWVRRIKQSLGPAYHIYQSKSFVLLTIKTRESSKYWLTVAENSLASIRASLGDMAWHWTNGKHVMLFFDDLDPYYRYISYFYPEQGEFATSGGIFLSRGYCHTAYPPQRDYTTTLLHELTHLSLSRLKIPKWLNEGLAIRTEFLVSGILAHWREPDEFRKHEGFWNAETIQRFWSGKGFSRPGDESHLNYSLAQILVENLATDHCQNFRAFTRDANREDAGEASARTHLGISLGDLAAGFLGGGQWAPVPSTWSRP